MARAEIRVFGGGKPGVRRMIGRNASGALRAELELGEFVVCDQFVDRTSGREDRMMEARV